MDTAAAGPPLQPGDDLSALAWVNGELRRSLEAANKSLRRYLKEAEAARGGDLDAVDPSVLRSARSQLHQGVGALELVGQPAVADVLRASEAAVQRLAAKPALVTAAAVDTVEKVSFAVLDFLARQLAGKPVSPVMLFPQYRAVLLLAGADRVHPADLWKQDWQWRELPHDAMATPRNSDDAARGEMETLALALMRQTAGDSARGPLDRMSDLCADLAAGARMARDGGSQLATFWQLAAAVFQAQAAGLLVGDVYVKRLASRLLSQLRASVRVPAHGHAELSDRLAQDLLFFCSHAKAPMAGHEAPRLAAVRKAWKLEAQAFADYETPRLGRFDPAVLALARKRVAAAKDSWSAVAGGELHRMTALPEQFSLVGESLQRLLPHGEQLAQTLQTAVATTVNSGQAPPPALAMEVATAILYLDASLEDGEFDYPELAPRVLHLSARIEAVRQGAEPQPLDVWMEELYRRVSDRQTMGSVVQELRTSLSEIEKQIDQYFRDPSQRQLLIPVPAQLSAMRGVLSVLGLSQASAAALHMRDDVDALAQTEVDPARAVQAGTFDRLADNLGALSFLIDMLAVQPALAKNLFRFDPETGSLSAVMGQTERVSAFAAFDDSKSGDASAALPSSSAVPLLEQLRELASLAALPGVADEDIAHRLEPLAQQAYAAGQPELARLLAGAQNTLRSAADPAACLAVRRDLAEAVAALSPLSAPPVPVSAPVPAPTSAPAGGTGLEDDVEMRDIFIEEAREVISDAHAAIARLGDAPENGTDLTHMRRAFHTLKGSARMVGLLPFGEAAWACEQLYNTCLAENAGADHDLRGFSLEVCDHFEQWVNALAAGDDRAFRPEPVLRAADALRTGHTRLPLTMLRGAASGPGVDDVTLALADAAAKLETPVVVETLEPLDLSLDGLFDLPSLPLLPSLQSLRDRIPDLPLASDLDLGLPAEPLPAAEPAAAVRAGLELHPTDTMALDLPDLDLAALDNGAWGETENRAENGALNAATTDGVDAEARPTNWLPVMADRQSEPTIDVAEATELDLALDFEATFGISAVAAPPAEPAPFAGFVPADERTGQFDPERTQVLVAERTQVLVPGPTRGGPVDRPQQGLSQALPDLLLDLDFDVETESETEAETTLLLPALLAGESLPDLPNLPDPPIAAPAAPRSDTVPEPTATPAQVAHDNGLVEDDTDACKQIGPLRIGIPLFNIYLNEADELSRRLGVELAEWAMEQHRPVGDAAVALAHSLAGSSGTVGFVDLSQLARLLEHALERAHARGEGRDDEATLFVHAADEIRRLLHLFAAGFLHAPDPELVRRLHDAAHAAPDAPISALMPLPMAEWEVAELGGRRDAPALAAAEPPLAEAPAAGETAPDSPVSDRPVPDVPVSDVPGSEGQESAPPVFEPLWPMPGALAADKPAAARPDLVAGDDTGLAALGRAALLPFAGLAEIAGPAVRRDGVGLGDGLGHAFGGDAIDDDIDVLDAVDEELFPIFTEEAQDELLPRLHASLRDWSRRPADAAPPSACMRCLHTLKGSARLAGAMRLGEIAHRLETAVARLAAEGAAARVADVERLIGHADILQACFDALQAPTAAPMPAPVPVPVPVPVLVPVLVPVPVPLPLPVAPTGQPVASAVSPASALGSLGVGLVPAAVSVDIDWSRFAQAGGSAAAALPVAATGGLAASGSVRVRTPLLDRLVNQAGEVSIARSRLESDVGQLKAALLDLTDNLERLRSQLRDIELQAETQIGTRMEAARAALAEFDPLEMDRFTRFQELTRMMAESVADVATVQRGLQRTLQSTEDALAHQARMTRDMQDDLLRTRMVEFEGLSERLYRVVRQAAKETAKSVRLDIVGGGVEIDRGVLDRMTPAFEHLLRNSVVHGIESPELRAAAGKETTGTITLAVTQVGNEVAVEVRDDGGGLQLARIRERGLAMGLIAPGQQPDDAVLANLVFEPGFSTATTLTGLAGRGIGMDVVRTDVNAVGGRIETASAPGQGTSFRLVLPLTTAVTQVVMLRCGERAFAVPSTLIEIVHRVKLPDLAQAYDQARFNEGGQALPFFWLDALLGGSPHGMAYAAGGRTAPVVVVRSAAQRVVLHVDEVLGNREVVVKNLGPQLSRVPGLVGMTLLPSGLPALIYNPVALATLYGDTARAATAAALAQAAGTGAARLVAEAEPLAPLVLVVDDSLTVRRITQRLLQREGYRVVVAKDGLDGLDKMAGELPTLLLTDIEMPRMDGFDLVRNMRADARLTRLPVIMITSRIAQKHRDYAAELGVDHYLGKPYAEDELLALVARYARRAVAA